MATERVTSHQSPWERLYGPNLGYVIDQYERYRKDPESVGGELKDLFDRWGPPSGRDVESPSVAAEPKAPPRERQPESSVHLRKVVAAQTLVQNIRTYGHLAAKTSPLKHGQNMDTSFFDLNAYNLTEDDLRAIPADIIWADAPSDVRNGLDAITRLRELYTETLAYEFSHVHDNEEREWLNQMVEQGTVRRALAPERRKALLARLIEVEEFEKFLHRTFVGQKRFSIEGLDSLVPMIDEIIREGMKNGAREVMIGMAHRGRLNLLAHVLGKPYKDIFSEFHRAPNKELVPSEGSMGINFGWSGDVAYHLGANYELQEGNALRARLTLANNPSHLEFVNPVVEGFTRAAQEDRERAGYPEQDVRRAMAILVHGDAAFPGEGIVAETLNLSRLSGYQTGGTIHIIANNRLGFTTESHDDRSTRYASDLAKGFEIPIVHVNADDPEACLDAVYIACAYRARFNKDFLIDLCGYRRFGHNEMDDPFVTQPQLYAEIKDHPTVRTQYAATLQDEGAVREDEIAQMEKQVRERLRAAYEELKKNENGTNYKGALQEPPAERLPKVDTAVPLDVLREINADLLKWPDGFTVYPKLKRILERRADALEGEGKVDWALAETLAFATILADGQPIRLTGQDTERGTFAHRHLVLHDVKTGESYSPLHALPQARASFAIHNSPLSEASVLGFEYGYDIIAKETFVLWEAQYGDFVNAAQVIIDQFIAAGRAKWGQESSLVMLLPHGYEGQGPEHSSGRLERFLKAAAENNWTVANLTTAAQYFHILRRQALIAGGKDIRPLIIMTPKSLIRHPHTASPGTDFSEGRFQILLEQPGLEGNEDRVERLILCSGKVAVDLATEMEEGDCGEGAFERLHIVRMEQLYPFPQTEMEELISRFKGLKEIVWVQEEPKNMGAWAYMEPRLKALAPAQVPVRYIGRPRRSSPAEGLPDAHNIEQERIVREALMLNEQGGSSRA